MSRLDITGQRYGRLTAVQDVGRTKYGTRLWECRCDCGATTQVQVGTLRYGNTTSCGCLRRDVGGANTKSHGHATKGLSPTYRCFNGMKARCNNPKNRSYKDYGGRGITVCARWSNFVNFLADMGEKPAGKTLDRKNVNGNYEPDNCRWATPKEQALNRRPPK